MPQRADGEPQSSAFEMRLAVPAQGGLRDIAGELAARVAEHFGIGAPEADALRDRVGDLAARVVEGRRHEEIRFAFLRRAGELIVEARCNDEVSEVRQPLPA